MDNLSKSVNPFALKILPFVLEGERGNSLFSPLGLFVILCSLAEGASGETANLINSFLNAGKPGGLAEAYGGWIEGLPAPNETLFLSLANMVMIRDDFDVTRDYLERLTGEYGFFAAVRKFDSAALDEINRWVGETTRGKITKILDKLLPDEKMVLANSIYFVGQWESRFQHEATENADFHCADGRTSKVPMMFLRANLRYYGCPQYQAVDLGYVGGRFSMTAVLPADGESPDQVFAGCLDRGIPFGKEPVYGELRLPRFEMDAGMDAGVILKKAGLEQIFSDQADFTGMNPRGDLNAGRMVQKSILSVDESGTIAASVTAATMQFRGMTLKKSEFTMTCDRPFIAAVFDNQYRLPILFAKIAVL
ncbi:MAG: hypothetical protein A2Y33_03250 [Spirochaetes bacterium GWF1_51_8]|nr:MAG: hypothetical protein A2Y33_03250 [Spirochaetes bacterium GWF1_51_8]